MWSKKPTPVAIWLWPAPSRFNSSRICVSAVFRWIVAVRGMGKKGARGGGTRGDGHGSLTRTSVTFSVFVSAISAPSVVLNYSLDCTRAGVDLIVAADRNAQAVPPAGIIHISDQDPVCF